MAKAMKHPVSLFAVWLGLAVLLHAQETPTPPARESLDSFLAKADPWTSTFEELAPTLGAWRFSWTSAAQDVARSDAPGLGFLNHGVTEALLRFREKKLSGATMFYFNRGDAGEIREDQFEKILAEVSEALTAFTGKPPKERGRDAGSAVKADGRIWETEHTRHLLEWSAVKGSRSRMIPFRAEFIRLTIQPAGASEPSALTPGKFNGQDHVVRQPNGDVVVQGIPMVDQGRRGYCVAASLERVMRFYGVEVDQHELAQVGNAQTGGGINTGEMMGGLRKLVSRLRISERTLCDWNLKDFLKMVADYNRATRRGKLAPEVQLDSPTIDVAAVYAAMNPSIYRDLRMKMTSDYGKFQRDIQRCIDEGLPLLWTVQLGLVSEKGLPQVNGGHMRLIIGYNPGTKEIIYSDSWGAGHEEKRMSFEDAWTMTTGLQIIQPVGS